MLIDEIKKRITQAMKDRSPDKEVLRVALGEIQTAEARAAKSFGDEEAIAIVKKLLKSNHETLAVTTDAEKKATLERENTVLQALLPEALSVDDIVKALAPVADAVKAAGNDGQATGVAMKHLKAAGARVDGKDVTLAVKELRGA